MARDSSGPKNEPQYAAVGVPADAADLTELGVYAALVGNRKALTKAAREALTGSDRWVGLEVAETDTNDVWAYTSGGWVLWMRGWTDYTPAVSGYTGTVTVARYCVVRGRVTLRIRTGVTGMTGNPAFSLPISAVDAVVQHMDGTCMLAPSAGSEVPGIIRKNTATQVIAYYSFVSGSVVYANNIGASTPFAWAGGTIDFTINYQAA